MDTPSLLVSKGEVVLRRLSTPVRQLATSMKNGRPSITAQRVAAQRLTFNRVPAPYGNPDADDALAGDVAGEVHDGSGQGLARYLSARTTFFDRVVVNSLDGGTDQGVVLGAGYDGRAFRYAKPEVRWFEVDHSDTQADKRTRLTRLGIDTAQVTFVPVDFSDGGLAVALTEAGYDRHKPGLLLCEGVAVYLEPPVLESPIREMRSVSSPASRLAISLSLASASSDESARRERFQPAVAAAGEPERNTLDADDADALFATTGWQALVSSQRAHRTGFIVAEPIE
jgi:methyltransferase (TIGR00027 family)